MSNIKISIKKWMKIFYPSIIQENFISTIKLKPPWSASRVGTTEHNHSEMPGAGTDAGFHQGGGARFFRNKTNINQIGTKLCFKFFKALFQI